MSAVHNPAHYNASASGVECITIAEHLGFNLGNAFKYVWRAGLKADPIVQDLDKALWYVRRERARRASNSAFGMYAPLSAHKAMRDVIVAEGSNLRTAALMALVSAAESDGAIDGAERALLALSAAVTGARDEQEPTSWVSS